MFNILDWEEVIHPVQNDWPRAVWAHLECIELAAAHSTFISSSCFPWTAWCICPGDLNFWFAWDGERLMLRGKSLETHAVKFLVQSWATKSPSLADHCLACFIWPLTMRFLCLSLETQRRLRTLLFSSILRTGNTIVSKTHAWMARSHLQGTSSISSQMSGLRATQIWIKGQTTHDMEDPWLDFPTYVFTLITAVECLQFESGAQHWKGESIFPLMLFSWAKSPSKDAAINSKMEKKLQVRVFPPHPRAN